jgi:GNAT superfamily N-acetyltransferase
VGIALRVNLPFVEDGDTAETGELWGHRLEVDRPAKADGGPRVGELSHPCRRPRFDLSVGGHEDGAWLEDHLYAYNVEQTGYHDGSLLTIWVKNDADEILAGLHGWTWGGSCSIRDLWVQADLRGQGYGTRLLQAAEQVARTRGCHHIVLEDHPRRHRNYYLRKRLT